MAEVRIDLTREDAERVQRILDQPPEYGWSISQTKILRLLIDAIREQIPEPKRWMVAIDVGGKGFWLCDRKICTAVRSDDRVQLDAIADLLNAAEEKS